MLFNSYAFIFVFLPLVVLGYALLGRLGKRTWALSFLTLASFGFYAWWNPRYLMLIFASILFNYYAAIFQQRAIARNGKGSRGQLVFAVVVNLALLAYYKYFGFFIDTINHVGGTHLQIQAIILPLAISFFTFTQLSYLVDVYNNEPSDHNLLEYALFVVFFPHLIAGPVVRHHEILPQIRDCPGRLNLANLPAGLTLFVFGLFSKTVLADSVSPYAVKFFQSVDQGHVPMLIEAWCGTLAYTCQLYFDFSGYSTMALGLAYLFDIKMPFNFNSPYKSASIIEFWRRWHMSLSRFLRDYLYIGLGGNRKGKSRRYVNLMITMLLGGLWHGAGWTFVIWGALHGLYLCINHAWGHLTKNRPWAASVPMRAVYFVITFVAVCVGWTVFRSTSLKGAGTIVASMAGLNGISLPQQLAKVRSVLPVKFDGISFAYDGLAWIVGLLAIAFFMPNVQQVMAGAQPSFEPVEAPSQLRWQANTIWALTAGVALAASIVAMSGHVSEFLYFQF